ncbi:MAG: hypothetical protein M3N51_05700 [Actinomycetota bacterium]|nr:hypothetical protein [Actinomycetota bacterium]
MERLNRGRASWLLLAASAWTFYVWGTRVFLLARQDETLAFKVVHFALAAISLGFGAAIGWVGWRMRRW